MVNVYKTGGDADHEAEDGDDDDDDVLDDEEGLAEAAIVVPECEQVDHGGEGQAHCGQRERTYQRYEES